MVSSIDRSSPQIHRIKLLITVEDSVCFGQRKSPSSRPDGTVQAQCTTVGFEGCGLTP